MNPEETMKEPPGVLQYLLNVFYVFIIRIFYDTNNVPDALGINCMRCNKCFGRELYNQTVKYGITVFVTNLVFRHIGLYWIIKSNYKLKFYFDHYCSNLILNGPWFNNKISSHLYSLSFEYYFLTAIKYRYNLICSIYSYNILNSTGNASASSGGGIPLQYGSTTDALK